MTPIRCVADIHDKVGEGPLWHAREQRLYWTDINGMRVHRMDPTEGRVETWHFHEPVSALALTHTQDCLLVGGEARLVLWNVARDERTVFAEFSMEPPGNRLNDGAAGPDGNFWVGSMRNNVTADGEHVELDWSKPENRTGSLYCVTPEGAISFQGTGLAIPNTMEWSPDGRMLYTGDSIDNTIFAYEHGIPSSRRVFTAGFGRGVPDGSAMDELGFLWNCRFFGGCIVRFTPSGEVDRVIEMPVTNITNCVFGGSDLQTLYVTTASVSAPANEPQAGGVFAFEPGVRGLSTYVFGRP